MKRYAAAELPQETLELLKFGRKFPQSPGLAIAASPLGPSAVRLLMSYATTVNMTSTVGALATYVMTGNGLFDPDVTGSGLQPLGSTNGRPSTKGIASLPVTLKFALPHPLQRIMPMDLLMSR